MFGIGVWEAVAGQKTEGVVTQVKTCWWLKVNTKMVRLHSMDGARFPHIIKVQYTVDGNEYTKRKWLSSEQPVPHVGDSRTVLYCSDNPGKAKVL